MFQQYGEEKKKSNLKSRQEKTNNPPTAKKGAAISLRLGVVTVHVIKCYRYDHDLLFFLVCCSSFFLKDDSTRSWFLFDVMFSLSPGDCFLLYFQPRTASLFFVRTERSSRQAKLYICSCT